MFVKLIQNNKELFFSFFFFQSEMVFVLTLFLLRLISKAFLLVATPLLKKQQHLADN